MSGQPETTVRTEASAIGLAVALGALAGAAWGLPGMSTDSGRSILQWAVAAALVAAAASCVARAVFVMSSVGLGADLSGGLAGAGLSFLLASSLLAGDSEAGDATIGRVVLGGCLGLAAAAVARMCAGRFARPR